MKKLLLAVLMPVFCLSTFAGYAQVQKRNSYDEIEKGQSKVQHAQLKNQIQKAIALKPYYKTIEIQNLCEKYPAAKRIIEEDYNRYGGDFQLVKAWTTQVKPINLPFLKHDYKIITAFHGRGYSAKHGTIIIRLPVAHDDKLLP